MSRDSRPRLVLAAAVLLAVAGTIFADQLPGAAPAVSTGLETSKPTTQPADFVPHATNGGDAPTLTKIPGSGVRWKENAFGVSFEVPINANTGMRPSGDSQVAVSGPGGEYMVDFFIRTVDSQPMEFDFLSLGVDRRAGDIPGDATHYLKQPDHLRFVADKNRGIDIDTVVDAALKQMGNIKPTAVLLDKPAVTIGKRPAAVLYFKIPADDPADLGKVQKLADNQGMTTMIRRNDWVLAQAFMMIDPLTVAIFQLDCEFATFADTRPKFEGLLASVEKEPFDQIDNRRKALIERGDIFLKSLKPAQLAASFEDEQWFSIDKDKTPVGWMRVNQKAGLHGKLQGYSMDVQYRLIQGDRAADVLANYFTAEDGKTDYWSSKTAVRSAREKKAAMMMVNTVGGKPVVHKGELPQAQGENAPSWIETGVRANGRIIITRESPTSKVEVQYEQPGKGFLSIVMGLAASTVLPHDVAGEWGFYAYDPRTGDLAFRTERVQTAPDGSRRVYTRAAPGSLELVTEFNAQGKLIRRTLVGGLTLVPTTKAGIAAIWGVPSK